MTRDNFREPREWFLAGYLWMDDLSVNYDYDNVLDGGKPTCLDSTWPVRTCRAASRLLVISLDLCGCRVLVHATSPRGDLPNRIARLKRG